MFSFGQTASRFFGGIIVKLFKVKNNLSKVLGLGAIGYIVGTYVALEHGGEEANGVAPAMLTVVGVITFRERF